MGEKTRVRSSVDALPEEERTYLNALLQDNGISYVDVAKQMTERGYPLSKSAVHRYAIRTNAAVKRLREIREQVAQVVQEVGDGQNIEATEAVTAILTDSLLRKFLTAEEDIEDMPIEKAGNLFVQLQRSMVYKERMRKDRARTIASVESNIMRRLQAELPNKDPELLARLQAVVSEAAREEAARDAAQDT